VPEKVGKALHDRKTQAETLASFSCGIVELMKFFKDCLKLQFRDAGAGVPNLDAQLVAASSAAKEEFAFGSVLHGVRQQIAHDLLEKTGIAAYGKTAVDHTPT
jgi:hypothetical protein